MKLMLKNVLIVDGSGWFPYWGDVVCEDGVVTYIAHGENTIMDQEASMDKIEFLKVGSPATFMLVDRKPVSKILAAYVDGKEL